MEDVFLYSRGELIFLETEHPVTQIGITTLDTSVAEYDVLQQGRLENGRYRLTIDAAGLKAWSPENPQLYELRCNDSAPFRFGHCEISTLGNQQILINNKPRYLRGYIRGIIAHDHPNMTGGTWKEACLKNIAQAKKYGFNLVRFHSTVPSPEFVEAADELGMLIHAEIGFSYEYDAAGNKQRLSLDHQNWVEVIKRYRNHPSMAIFCIGNEMHNAGHQPGVMRLYEIGKELAPNKLIMDNAGWGEYDRGSADLFAQHIAYFFPLKKHAGMFQSDQCWRINGSAYDAPLQETVHEGEISASVRRQATPIKPVLAHEAMHYIDIPDYAAQSQKYDAFASRVGDEWLQANGIRKPRYLTELPKLIARKKLTGLYADYIEASRKFKKLALKTYLERLRFSSLCGFEMLQFADCLKYENNNGIVDFFDDDKYICPAWMQQFNADTVLLADFSCESYWSDQVIPFKICLSHYGTCSHPRGTLQVTLQQGSQSSLLYRGENFILVTGLQTLVELNLRLPALEVPTSYTLQVCFNGSGLDLQNSWEFWRYPPVQLEKRPVLELQHSGFTEFVNSLPVHQDVSSTVVITDCLDQPLLTGLEQGKTMVLLYHRDDPWNQYYWPGALERFKPCIWDRGSNLGTILQAPWVQQALASGKYGGMNLQPLLENGYKINLDDFPCLPEEYVCGVDKPVRDRMKGLIHGVKDFLETDTLRRFSHLFALRVGSGTLVVCTFNKNSCREPAAASFFAALLKQAEQLQVKAAISPENLLAYLQSETSKGVRKEDVMNHFWELDNKPVEDTLFWEETGINLADLK
ncbi:MAG: glycoside hydrolase family 2 TIM barrel-domain containing protein [Lentisphaeria bacterium]